MYGAIIENKKTVLFSRIEFEKTAVFGEQTNKAKLSAQCRSNEIKYYARCNDLYLFTIISDFVIPVH